MAIRFYRVNEAYGCFSNFSPHPILLQGKEWSTSEHFFQAQKFPYAPEYQEKIRQAKGPMEAANLGRTRSQPLRPDWEQVKDAIMREAVTQKFQAHRDIQQTLLATAGQDLIEATTDDYYWGEGTNKNGKNMLGIILMDLRSTLLSTNSDESP